MYIHVPQNSSVQLWSNQMLTFVSTKSQSKLTWPSWPDGRGVCLSEHNVTGWCVQMPQVSAGALWLVENGARPSPSPLTGLTGNGSTSFRACVAMEVKLDMDVLISLQGCEWQMFQYSLRNHVLPHSRARLYNTHALFHCKQPPEHKC